MRHTKRISLSDCFNAIALFSLMFFQIISLSFAKQLRGSVKLDYQPRMLVANETSSTWDNLATGLVDSAVFDFTIGGFLSTVFAITTALLARWWFIRHLNVYPYHKYLIDRLKLRKITFSRFDEGAGRVLYDFLQRQVFDFLFFSNDQDIPLNSVLANVSRQKCCHHYPRSQYHRQLVATMNVVATVIQESHYFQPIFCLGQSNLLDTINLAGNEAFGRQILHRLLTDTVTRRFLRFRLEATCQHKLRLRHKSQTVLRTFTDEAVVCTPSTLSLKVSIAEFAREIEHEEVARATEALTHHRITIAAEQLWQKNIVIDGRVLEQLEEPNHIVIHGEAGAGKTTWSTVMAQRWARRDHWCHIDWLLVIPLRELKAAIFKWSRAGRNFTEDTEILAEVWRLAMGLEETEITDVYRLHWWLSHTRQQIVYILEGYDEVMTSHDLLMNRFLGLLFRQQNVLVSTRPCVIPGFTVDRALQLAGLNKAAQIDFIQNYFSSNEAVDSREGSLLLLAESFQEFLFSEEHDFYQSITQNPFLMELFCWLYFSEGRFERTPSLLDIYQLMLAKLRQRWLEKNPDDGQSGVPPATEKVKIIFQFLENLAYTVWKSGENIILPHVLRDTYARHNRTFREFGLDFKRGVVEGMGLLRPQSFEPDYLDRQWWFLHATIQEHLAMCGLARQVAAIDSPDSAMREFEDCSLIKDGKIIPGRSEKAFPSLCGLMQQEQAISTLCLLKPKVWFDRELIPLPQAVIWFEGLKTMLNRLSQLPQSSHVVLRQQTDCITRIIGDDEMSSISLSAIFLMSGIDEQTAYMEILVSLGVCAARPVQIDDGLVLPTHFFSKHNSLKALKWLCSNEVDLLQVLEDGITALMVAAKYGHFDTIKFLIGHDENVNRADSDGKTALMMAVANGHIDVTKFLVAEEADVNKADNLDNRALIVAAKNGFLPAVEFLLDSGADISLSTNSGYSALMAASARGHLEVVELLVRREASIHQSDKAGRTALMMAAEHGHFNVVSYLLTQSAEINQTAENGFTALMAAAASGNINIVKILLTHGAVVNQTNNTGRTALMYAVEAGHLGVVKYLLDQAPEDKRADVFLTDREGKTALDYTKTPAVKAHLSAKMRRLAPDLDAGRYADIRARGHRVGFLDAAKSGQVEILDRLLTAGADVNQVNRYGDSALILAALNGHLLVVNWLLAKSAEVNKTNNNGETPLMLAARFGRFEVVDTLLKCSATIDLTRRDGSSALMLAAKNGHLDVIEILLAHNAAVDRVDSKGRTALMYAAAYGDIRVIENLISRRALVDHADNQGNTALMLASSRGHKDVVEYLIAKGADVNKANGEGGTAINCAVRAGHLGVITYLIEEAPVGRRANLHLKDKYKRTAYEYAQAGSVKEYLEEKMRASDIRLPIATPTVGSGKETLITAARGGSREAVASLLARGIGANAENQSGETGLMLASQYGHVDVVDLLLKRGADVDKVKKDGSTALTLAAGNGCVRVVRLLLEYRASINHVNQSGESALILAATKGYVELVELLLNHEASMDLADKSGKVALHYAAIFGHVPVVEMLLVRGAKVDIPDASGATSLVWAVERGHYRVAVLLLRYHASVDTVTASGNTLIIAVQRGDVNLVRLLLRHSITVNLGNSKKITALMLAAKRGSLEILELLLDASADVGLADDKGCTALMVAASNNHLRAVELLLEHGANVNQTNGAYMTALNYAVISGHAEVVKLLIDKGASLTGVTQYGETALMRAAESGRKEMVDLLLTKGVDVNEVRRDGRTALQKAAEKGCLDIVKLLVANGADVDHANNEGKTALMLSAINKHQSVVRYLVEEAPGDRRANLLLMDREEKKASDLATDGEIKAYLVSKTREAEATMDAPTKAAMAIRSGTGGPALIEASRNGQAEMVRALIELEANVNEADGNGWTVLMAAAANGHCDIVKLLVEASADLSLADTHGFHALIYAAWQGHSEVVEFLLSTGVDAEHKGTMGWTALSLAIWVGRVDVVKVFLEKGLVSNEGLINGYTAMMLAAYQGNTDLIKLFLAHRLEVNKANEYNQTAILCALGMKKTAAVKLLLENGADVFSTFKRAITLKDTNILTALFCAGVDIDVTDAEGLTVLNYAIKEGHPEIVRFLLSQGANGFIAFKVAILHNDVSAVEQLLDSGAEPVQVSSDDGTTALAIAVEAGHDEIVRLLLARGDSGLSSLNLAIIRNDMSLLEKLLECGVEVNQEDADGKTALAFAILNNYIEAKNFLLRRGADEQKVLSWAVKSDNKALVTLLLDEGANVNYLENNETLLMLAAKKGHRDIVSLLLERGADIFASIKLAIENNQQDIFAILVAEGVDLDAVNAENLNALMIAAQGERGSIVSALCKLGANSFLALQLAIKHHYVDIAERLLKHGVGANLASDTGLTILYEATHAKEHEIAKLLVQYGADGLLTLKIAIKRKDIAVVNQLIDYGVDIDQADDDGLTALILAARTACSDIARLLIEHGANSLLALKIAIRNRDKGLVMALLECGIDVRQADGDGLTALVFAAQKADPDIAKILLDHGADGLAALQWSVKHNNIETVSALLSCGIDVNHEGDDDAPIMLAARHGYREMLEYLLCQKAQINYVSDKGNTVLITAAQAGHHEVVRLLLERGCDALTSLKLAIANNQKEVVTVLSRQGVDLNQLDERNLNALLIAAEGGYQEMVPLLLELGADGFLAFHLAINQRNVELVVKLLEYQVDPNLTNDSGLTALYMATKSEHHEIARCLLGNGANGLTALKLAIDQVDMGVILQLLEYGVDVNQIDEDGLTALTFAVERNSEEIVRILLERGADGLSALTWAISRKDISFVERLLSFGVEFDQGNEAGMTALGFAMKCGFHDAINLLLEKGASEKKVLSWAVKLDYHAIAAELLDKGTDINKSCETGTLLMLAVKNGHLRMAQFLLERGADMDYVTCDGETALIIAAQEKHREIIRLLLDNGADALATLKLAIENDQKEVVSILSSLGVDLNQANDEGMTALMIAARVGFGEMIALLQSLGVDCQKALKLAIEHNDKAMVEQLFDAGIDIFQADAEGWTALLFAVEKDRSDIVRLMLDRDVTRGFAALRWAVEQNNPEMAEKLLKFGVDPNQTWDGKRWNPLKFAVMNGYSRLVSILLENRADVNQPFKLNKTLLMLLVERNHCDLIKQVLGFGVNIDQVDNFHRTALMWAVLRNNIESAEVLLKAGAKLSLPNKSGLTVLMLAAEKSGIDMVKLLLDFDVDVDQVDNMRTTALMFAAKEGKLDVVRYLIEIAPEGKRANPLLKDRSGKTAYDFAREEELRAYLKEQMDRAVSCGLSASLQPRFFVRGEKGGGGGGGDGGSGLVLRSMR